MSAALVGFSNRSRGHIVGESVHRVLLACLGRV